MTFQPRFDPIQVAKYNYILMEFAKEHPSINILCVATVDGFEVTSYSDGIVGSHGRVAAIASSMHALGNVINTEVGLGECQNVFVEGTMGKAILLAIPDKENNKVLIVSARSGTNLGMLLTTAKICCQNLAEVG
jgi:predicted regulator of Ras-like GTPase activity (Roadblock/LC7/MglB family)